MPECFFVSDLHGSVQRYHKLFDAVRAEPPAALFLGGDLLPGGTLLGTAPDPRHQDFVNDFLVAELRALRRDLGSLYPRIFVILGNDDPRFEEASLLDAASRGVWQYLHDRRSTFAGYPVFGYSCIPPSPFSLKDWERYDVSRFVDPGCSSPEEGMRTVPVSRQDARYGTIASDLDSLTRDRDVSRAIFMFHTPPYRTKLDRAALDGRMVDHAPLDVHIGSIAVRRWIEQRQPLVTLHGHVHESARITGAWHDRLGRTIALSAAHDGPELALVRFSPSDPTEATRELL